MCMTGCVLIVYYWLLSALYHHIQLQGDGKGGGNGADPDGHGGAVY